MNPAQFDPATVAARLTPAQRDAVLRGGISDHRSATVTVLRRELIFYAEPTIGTVCFSFALTRFGEAVRAHLVEANRPVEEKQRS